MPNSSLILRRAGHLPKGKCALAIRTHDLGGTDYTALATLTIDQAHGIAAAYPDIHWLYPESAPPEVSAMRLHLSVRNDPHSGYPHCGSWKVLETAASSPLHIFRMRRSMI